MNIKYAKDKYKLEWGECKRTTSSGIFDSQFGNFGTDNFRNLN